MRVIELWRHPVKSLQGERLEETVVEADGVTGDRSWGVYDRGTSLVLTGRREPRLLTAAAVLASDGTPTILLDDGSEIHGEGPETAAALSDWLGRDVVLARAADSDPGVAEAFTDSTDDDSDAFQWVMPQGRFVDAAPLLVVTTASLRSGKALHADGEWDTRRFRPNIVVDVDGDGWVEDGWCGHLVRIGAVEIDVRKRTGRCTMVTRPQPGLARDLDMFRTLAREHGATFGVWCFVNTPGSVRIGDQVTVVRPCDRLALKATQSIRPFVPVTIAVPVLGSAMGIDGGAIFQIFATENLQLSPSAIGLAFGLGVVSLPVQLWAARLPLWRARHNLQRFLIIAAVHTFVLAALVGWGSGSGLTGIALVATVTAEIALSILYATSYQPLLSHCVSSRGRQQLNTRGRAAGGGLLLGGLVLFAALPQSLRAAFLVVVGLAAVASAVFLQPVEEPATVDEAESTIGEAVDADAPRRRRPPMSSGLRLLLAVFAIVNLGAWPVLVIYVDKVLWPSANLGVIGGLQIVGAMVTSLAWRPTTGGVAWRARVAGVILLAAGAALCALRSPLDSGIEQAALLLAILVAAGSISTIRIALLEMVHRATDRASSVRVFTILDVVASTSAQVGLLIGGLLVTASAQSDGWAADPYRLYVLGCSVAGLAAIALVPTKERSAP